MAKEEQSVEFNRRDLVKSQLAAEFAVSLLGCAGIKSPASSGLQSSTEQPQEKNRMRMPKGIVTAKPHIEGAGVSKNNKISEWSFSDGVATDG